METINDDKPKYGDNKMDFLEYRKNRTKRQKKQPRSDTNDNKVSLTDNKNNQIINNNKQKEKNQLPLESPLTSKEQKFHPWYWKRSENSQTCLRKRSLWPKQETARTNQDTPKLCRELYGIRRSL